MSELLPTLRQAGFSELACQFARFIKRIDRTGDDLIAITAALVSEASSQGHVCLNLVQMINNEASLSLGLPATLSDWIVRLRQSHVVGLSGDYSPLIVTDEGLVYLYRFWQDEHVVAKAIQQRLHTIEINNHTHYQQAFADWHNDVAGVDWQKVAVFMALTRQFCVISGRPGTGKTTIILSLLNMLFDQEPHLKVALAAPTGKATARLQQTIADSGNQKVEAKTLHRLLGITENNDKGRYSQQKPLAIDLLIVDEASMIDISLMAKLMQALPDKARLVLLGDSQQLASVESGAVLANLCSQSVQFSTQFCTSLKQVTDINGMSEKATSSALNDSVVMLKHSYRFDDASTIGQLAKAIQSGEEQLVYNVLVSEKTPIWQQNDIGTIQACVFENYQPYFEAVTASSNAIVCLNLFEQFRVLCALKQGPQSVASVNELITRQLQKQGWKTHQGFYHGRPIMVTQNDYRQQLFNGDTGLVLHDETGELRACFLTNNEIRWVEISRLPAHETAFAITVHKSQGAEFDKVCVLLPEEDNAILNRELLYTAITRAKKQIRLLCTEAILRKTVMTQHQRESGLAKLLTSESKT